MRHAPCAMRHAPCAMRHAPCAMRHAPCAMRHAPCAMRHAPCAMRHAPSSQKLHNAAQCFLIYRNASPRRHFFDNVCSFSCISLYREVRSGLLCICLTARRSDTGNPRISCSMAYSSPISFRASSAVALLVLIYTSWILRRA
ncbi:Uncharacterised protein [Shigella sonnei]|nr:Uncharacterised protein [Shigella sonnei]